MTSEIVIFPGIRRHGYFEQLRMDWIAETLRVFGFINRGHLVRKFRISVPQASHDLNEFMRLQPDAMAYDKSRKCYVSTAPLEEPSLA